MNPPDDAWFQTRDARALGVGAAAYGPHFVGNDEGPLVGQHVYMNPTLRALPIANLPPSSILGDDLNGQELSAVHPFHRIFEARPGAHIDYRRVKADEAR